MKQLAILLMTTIIAFSCKEKESKVEQVEDEKLTEMQQNLSKYVPVELTADLSGLTDNEREMLPILIKAADKMNDLFWYEAYGDCDALLNSISDKDVKKYASINYGPWDRLANNKPFVEGIGEKPKGANYYP